MLSRTLLLVLSVIDWTSGCAHATEPTTQPTLVIPHTASLVVAKEPTTKPSVRGAHANWQENKSGEQHTRIDSTDKRHMDQYAHATDTISTAPTATRELSDEKPWKYDNNGNPLNWDAFKQRRNDRSLKLHLRADIEEENRTSKQPAPPTPTQTTIPTKRSRVRATNKWQPRLTKTRALQNTDVPRTVPEEGQTIPYESSVVDSNSQFEGEVSEASLLRTRTPVPNKPTTAVPPTPRPLLSPTPSPTPFQPGVLKVQSYSQRRPIPQAEGDEGKKSAATRIPPVL